MTTIEIGPDDCAIVLRPGYAEIYMPKNTETDLAQGKYVFMAAIGWAIDKNPEAFNGLMEAFAEYTREQEKQKAN